MKLKEKNIIKKGGSYYTDKFGVQWIEIIINSRSKLIFYNYGTGFNVYLTSNEEKTMPIQLTTIKSILKLKLLLFILNYLK